MSDQQQQPAPPPAPAAPAAPGRAEVEAALLRAIEMAATKSMGATDARETQEYAAAALALSQAVVILDPALVAPQGVPPQVLAASTPQQQPSSGGGQKP